MSDVIAIVELDRNDDDSWTVIADVDGVVAQRPATFYEPAEFGPALCRGTFYVQDDEVIPADDDQLCAFIGQRVNYWEVLDFSDSRDAG